MMTSNLQMRFLESSSARTGKRMVALDCWGDSASETCLCLKNRKSDRFEIFDLTMNWIKHFLVQMKSNCKITMNIESSSKMDHETCVKRLIWKFWVWWPFLTWPWPWPELNIKNVASQYLQPVLGSTYEKFWAKNATFKVSTVRNLNTPDFDLWPDLDLIRDLNFKFPKVLWKCIVQIFRMPPLSSIYDHQFLR